jgi:hypothetical protein
MRQDGLLLASTQAAAQFVRVGEKSSVHHHLKSIHRFKFDANTSVLKRKCERMIARSAFGLRAAMMRAS